MGKLIKMPSVADKKGKLEDVANYIEEVKDVLIGIIDEYELDHSNAEKADTLTEALDALEDAFEAVNDVLMDE